MGRRLSRFKIKSWLSRFINTIVKMTMVFFVLVTALQATEYGSLRISNTLSNADLAETTANASESVSNNASNILVKEALDAEQSIQSIVLPETLLSGDAPIAEAVVITPITPVEPVPVQEQAARVSNRTLIVKQNTTEQAPIEQVQLQQLPVEKTPTEQISVETIPIETIPAKLIPAELIPAEQAQVQAKTVKPISAEKTLAQTKPAESKPAESKPAESKPAQFVPDTQPLVEQENTPVAAKQPALSNTLSLENQQKVEAISVTPQTTLNQPSGKFKFNVVTDTMIDSLNSIIPQTAASSTMSLDTFHLMIAAAVASHPEMRAVVEQTKVAGYASSEAFGAYLPQISASVDAGTRTSRSSTSSDLLPKGEGVDAAMSVKQLLYDFGATGASYDSAKYKEQASLERLATKRSELSFRTISAYIELLRARLLHRLAQENYNSRLSILNMVKERYELGGGNKVDVIRAEARLTDASATNISAVISLQMAEAGYKEMFLQDPYETPLPQDVSIDLANQSIDELSKRYGAVRETELGLKSLRSDATAAASRMLPTLNFELNGARRSQETYYGEYSETSAHLVMRYNLFTGGADSARRQQAIHRAEQTQQDLDNLILQVKKSIVQSTTQVNEAEGLVRVRREGVLGASQSLLAVKEHFTYRRGTLLDLLRSQEELYTAGRDYISSLMDRSIARYRLLHLTAALETMIPDLKSQ